MPTNRHVSFLRPFRDCEVQGKPHIFAAYTCTPLVSIPVSDLKPGAHIKGRTIAELGNRNRPLDMIAYRKGGNRFLLIANSSRGVMKVPTESFATAKGITEPVSGGATGGVKYEMLASWKKVDELDLLGDSHVLILRENDDGSFDLETVALP